jgi:hypothetical protein
LPATVTSPLVGASRPSTSRIVVDLPEPFGPRKPVTIPGLTENDRSFTAVVSPYRFVRPLASIMRSSSIPGDQSLGAVHKNWMRGAADRVWLDSAACS